MRTLWSVSSHVGTLSPLMECLEDDGASCLEDDLALSGNEIFTAKDHWPELLVVNNHSMLTTQHGNQQSTSSSFNKRRADYSTTEECQLPAASAKYVEPTPQPSMSSSGVLPPSPSKPMPQLPAFVPRDDYVKLSFDGNSSTDTKLHWLSAVHKTFQLQRELAEAPPDLSTSRDSARTSSRP